MIFQSIPHNLHHLKVYLEDGVKLNKSLCENQRDLEYTYNFLGSSAQLKFNQETTMNLIVSNKNFPITFETLLKELKTLCFLIAFH